jgi:hypothetical protein
MAPLTQSAVASAAVNQLMCRSPKAADGAGNYAEPAR